MFSRGVRSAWIAGVLLLGVGIGEAKSQDTPAAASKPPPPAACTGSYKLADCRDALTALLETAPDDHVMRLRRADMHHRLQDHAKAAQDIAHVRGRLASDQFAAALAASDHFVEVGDAGCRFVGRKSRDEQTWIGPCAGGFAHGRGLRATIGNDIGFTTVSVAREGVIVEEAESYVVERTFKPELVYHRVEEGDRWRRTTEAALPAAVRPVLGAFVERFPAQRPELIRKREIQPTAQADQRFDNGEPFLCFSLYTRPGEHWLLSLEAPGRTPWLGVQAREYCERTGWNQHPFQPGVDAVRGTPNSGLVRYAFTSSGGTYWVAVAAGPAGGAVTLKMQQQEMASGKPPLAAGPPAPYQAPFGVASTIKTPSARTYEPGQMIRDCPVCPELVVVPAGEFMMGSPATEDGRKGDEGPRRLVTIGRPFAIGKFEVTFDDWNACVADGGCVWTPADNGWGKDRRPVIDLGYADMVRYVGWLTYKTGYHYFLPSEAEWEYAARAGTDTPWNTGDGIITDDANFLNQYGRTVPVGGFAPNAFGLYDTHGNVAELTQDCMDVGYFEVPGDGGAKLKPAGCVRSGRGGSYADEPARIRSAARVGAPNTRSPSLGFRVTRALD